MIYPFEDGNGRMSHIILNVLHLKDNGQLSLLERRRRQSGLAEYRLERTQGLDQVDMVVSISYQRSHCELAEYVLAKSTSRLVEVAKKDIIRW